MSMLTKEKEKVLTIDQIYGEFLSAEMVSNQNETSIVTVSSNSNDVPAVGITFLDEKIGALICDDIGNRDYDAIYKAVMNEYKSLNNDKFDPEDKVFHEMVRERLKTLPIEISGYKLIDFASGTVNENGEYKATGFQGGIYYNETTGEYVVVCRGTEFDGGEEQFKDFVKTDICEFGQDEIPEDFKETKKLLDNLLKNGVAKSQIHIVGHSLGGGVAQMLGAMDDYKDIDVTTYNAVGVEHLLNDMQSAGYVLQNNAKNATNINNYVTCNDFVSTIFNIIGNKTIVVDPINKNDSLKNHIQWQIESGGKSDTILTKLISSISYLTSGHGIENFIGDDSFNECDDLKVYKSITDFLKLIKGDALVTIPVAHIVGWFLGDEPGDNVVSKIKHIFNRKESDGVATGGAAPIEGGISYDYYPPEYVANNLCKSLAYFSEELGIDVIVKATNSYNQEDTIFISTAEDAKSTITEIKNGYEVYDEATGMYEYYNGYNYFEAYYKGCELIYDEVGVYRPGLDAYIGTGTVDILKELLNTENNSSLFNYIQILENEAGDSTVLISENGGDVGGEAGYDKYILPTNKDAYVYISDTDKHGVLISGNTKLLGTDNYIGGDLWIDDAGNRYKWSGIGNETLVINDTISISNFNVGDLGIFLSRFPMNTHEAVDPLVIDLNGDGITLLPIDESDAYFDLNADGSREKVQWVDSNDGFLVLDRNSDGVINNIDELFGNPNTIGFEDLSQYDDNSDGVIDSNDVKFSQMRVWQDINSNGLLEEGELTTLAERNISKINLNYEAGDDETFAEKSTVEYTDGTTGLIQDINLEVNYMNTKYETPESIPESVAELPQIRGSGSVKDLYSSMIADTDLQTYVANLVTKSALEIYNGLDTLLKMWTGLEDISNDTMRGLCPEYLVGIVEKFYNRQYVDEETGSSVVENPNIANSLQTNYEYIKTRVVTDIILQSGTYSFLDGIEYDIDTNTYSLNVSKQVIDDGIKNYVQNIGEVETAVLAIVLDGLRRKYVYDFDSSILSDECTDKQKLILSGKYSVRLDNILTEMNDLFVAAENGITMTDAHGSDVYIMKDGDNVITDTAGSNIYYLGSGNDSVYNEALDCYTFVQAGAGNDNIYIYSNGSVEAYGENGNDEIEVSSSEKAVVSGGLGNDIVRLSYTNAVFEYNLGDGNDLLILDNERNDISIRFGEGISWEDLEFSQITETILDEWNNSSTSESLLIKVKNDENTITVRYWFGGESGEYSDSTNYKVDKFIFSDGSIYTRDDIPGEVYIGTDGDDTLEGTVLNNTYNGQQGNDVSFDPEGKDIYIFNLGDGKDTITDVNGVDKIVFGENITIDDVEFYREQDPNNSDSWEPTLYDDLVIKIKNTSDEIRIKNYYYEEESNGEYIYKYQIENIEFVDGTIINAADIENLRILPSTSADEYVYGKIQDDTYTLSGNDTVIDISGNDIYASTSGNQYIIDKEIRDVSDIAEPYDEEKFESYQEYEEYLSTLSLGSDVYNLGSGNDTIVDESPGNDIIYSGAGNDEITVGGVSAIVYAEEGDDKVTVTSGNSIVSGGDGDDLISAEGYYGYIRKTSIMGDAGNDYIKVSEFAEAEIIGGIGDDQLEFRGDKLVYNFNIGDGSDIITFNYQYKTCDSKIKFGEGITWDDLIFTQKDEILNQEEVDLYGVEPEYSAGLLISIKGTEDSITIRYWFGKRSEYDENYIYQIEKFEFSDGSVYTKDDIILGEPMPDIEDNVYNFNKGDGSLVIRDYYGNDKIILGNGITSEDVEFYRVQHEYDEGIADNYWASQFDDDLLIKFKNSDDEIRVMNYYSLFYDYDETGTSIIEDSPHKIEILEFSDGSVLTPADIESMRIVLQTPGDDYIVDKGQDDIYNIEGNDIINDYSGNDIYNSTSGGSSIVDMISIQDMYSYEMFYTEEEYGSYEGYKSYLATLSSGNDKYYLGSGIDNIDDSSPGDDIIYSGSGDDYIYAFAPGIVTIYAEDGDDYISVYDRDFAFIYGGNGSDTLNISGNNNANLYGDFGNDYIMVTYNSNINVYGGEDSDTISVEESSDSNINGDSGNDIISILNCNNLVVSGGIGIDNIELTDSNNSIISGNADDDTITLLSGDNNTIYSGTGNDTIIASTSYDYESSISININGEDDNDNISVTGYNDVTIDGGSGNDEILVQYVNTSNVSGGDGNDIINTDGVYDALVVGGLGSDTLNLHNCNNIVIEFNLGDGSDTIYLNNQNTTTLKFGEGITWTDLEFQYEKVILEEYSWDTTGERSIYEENMIIKVKNSEDQITVKYWFGAQNVDGYDAGNNYKINSFEFADGSIYTADDIIEDLIHRSNAVIGTSDADIISGSSNNNIYYLGKGNDTIIENYASDDIYIFNKSDGHDNITDLGGSDIIHFGEGITQEEILFTKDNNDLIMSFNDSEDNITINNWGSSYDNQIESFKFSDGTSITNINALIYNYKGTSESDTIVANTQNNLIDGGEGSDIMFGDLGNDTYIIDNVNDVVIEYTNEGIDTIESSVSYSLSEYVENITLTGDTNIDASGNTLNNIIRGNSGDNILSGGDGDDTYIFGLNNGGNDTIIDELGNNDVIFDDTVSKLDIAIYKDGNSLVIDYGNESGQDRILIQDSSSVDKIELSDGSYISDEDVNLIIQNMTAYAQNNSIEFTSIDSVKNNDDLMNIVASSWQG